MTEQPDRTAVVYGAIDAFQRTHRLPGLQHAQIRGLLAEHLARVLPLAVPAVPAPATDRECAASISGHCLAEGQSETACDTDAGECVHGGKPATDQAAPTDWIDGHPQLEAIAAAVWEQCRTEGTSLVVDDPRNIAVAALAAVLPAPADRAAEEAYRLALSTALGLGTGANWEAIRDRAEDLVAEVEDLTAARRRLLNQQHPDTDQTADRATVLREAAGRVLEENHRCTVVGLCQPCLTRTAVSDLLRRMADETQQPEEQAAPDARPGTTDYTLVQRSGLLRRSEDVCPGFPDRCPNLRTVEPETGVHLGGVRCGCADEAAAAQQPKEA